eukprot:15461617-Alexandrium_andersonii.AAC.1
MSLQSSPSEYHCELRHPQDWVRSFLDASVAGRAGGDALAESICYKCLAGRAPSAEPCSAKKRIWKSATDSVALYVC